jgi:cytochrome c oxidase cbb3-type subunit 4
MHAMDIDDMRAAMTVLSFVAFLAIVAWAYGRGRSGRFGAAAQLPFDDEPDGAPAASKRAEG